MEKIHKLSHLLPDTIPQTMSSEQPWKTFFMALLAPSQAMQPPFELLQCIRGDHYNCSNIAKGPQGSYSIPLMQSLAKWLRKLQKGVGGTGGIRRRGGVKKEVSREFRCKIYVLKNYIWKLADKESLVTIIDNMTQKCNDHVWMNVFQHMWCRRSRVGMCACVCVHVCMCG